MHRNKIGFLVAAGMLGATLIIPATATATQPDALHKVTICHRTNSVINPYTNPTVDEASVDGDKGNDHGQGDHLLNHLGPAFDFSADPDVTYPTPRNGDQWGDIIPPFYSDGVTPTGYPSLNWDAAGQAIFYAGCNAPAVVTTTTSDETTTTTDATTTSDETTTTTDATTTSDETTTTTDATTTSDETTTTTDATTTSDETTTTTDATTTSDETTTTETTTSSVSVNTHGQDGETTTTSSTSSQETTPTGHVEGLTPPATDTIGQPTSTSTVSTSLLLVLAGVLSFVLVAVPATARKRR